MSTSLQLWCATFDLSWRPLQLIFTLSATKYATKWETNDNTRTKRQQRMWVTRGAAAAAGGWGQQLFIYLCATSPTFSVCVCVRLGMCVCGRSKCQLRGASDKRKKEMFGLVLFQANLKRWRLWRQRVGNSSYVRAQLWRHPIELEYTN